MNTCNFFLSIVALDKLLPIIFQDIAANGSEAVDDKKYYINTTSVGDILGFSISAITSSTPSG